jgi:hypothetical protein
LLKDALSPLVLEYALSDKKTIASKLENVLGELNNWEKGWNGVNEFLLSTVSSMAMLTELFYHDLTMDSLKRNDRKYYDSVKRKIRKHGENADIDFDRIAKYAPKMGSLPHSAAITLFMNDELIKRAYKS